MASSKETDVERGDANSSGGSSESPKARLSDPHQPEKATNTPTRPGKLMRLRRHIAVDVDTRWADVVMITCCFISGLIDSVSFNTWGCFVSMQTGMLDHFSLHSSKEFCLQTT